ncbi:MAG: DegV family EDD domain-containing protein [Candidatus Heimdallarchaeota archaeon]|nr:DegV family EDD domain-containing protein [Candidatus Heimdallarchaeota archaeon]
MKVKILTDSTSQIPLEYAKKNNITLIQPTIDLDGEYFKELTEVNYEDFVSKMSKMNPVPKTSVANPQDVLEIFEQIIKEGYDEVLYLYLTPKLSNQIDPVRLGYKKVKDKLKAHFYPTEFAATSQAPFVLYGQELLDNGEAITSITKTLDKMKPHIFGMGISTSFDILFRTGKIQKTAKMSMISSLMNLKPIYTSEHDKGFASGGAGTGFGSAIKKIVQAAEEKTKADMKYNMIITHVENEKLGRKLEDSIKKIREIGKVDYWNFSPCVGNSLGYGTAMVTLYPTLDALK